MTEDMPEDDALFVEALDLIIRLQNDPDNPVARDLVRRWRARGPRHEAAWAEAVELHGMAGEVLRDGGRTGAPSRRKVILGAAAGAAALGLGALYAPELRLSLMADHMTSTAELRRIALEDGTAVTLGPDSAIATTFTPEHRQVELLDGMAFFQVADDTGRPFRGIAGDLSATARAAAFAMSRDAGFLTVSVDRGGVDLAAPQARFSAGVRLSRGEWLTLDGRSSSIERGARDPGQIAAWRDGLVVAERDTVAAVVARIARWQPGRVLIADTGLGERRISGVFDLHNPVAALRAVVQPHGGTVRRFSPWLTVISSV
ncbi:FecR domain-containing protein [Kaustia mangrovi]|uniref:FecR domain-containing protein n=2 Tax=Kaustia mangrovi TaxID=2593653 RepID=A0A7S8HE00_9HYPH|nr:FecR domain-containing protein [Kaustia mangrovi]